MLQPSAESASSETTVKILHLSDLHFGATFDPSLWDYVSKVLAGTDKPNVLIVTGDLVDTPSFFMLGLARKELNHMRAEWCCGDKKCELLVIPGNHDVGIYGNWATWLWRWKFNIVFSKEHASLFDLLPRYMDYIARPWYRRWSLRAMWVFVFALLRVTQQLRRPPKGSLVTDCCGNSLCVASFDSNGELWLASGRIDAAEITQVHSELMQRRLPDASGRLLNLVPRVALVHHHVIAIPYASVIESLTDFEPFLTLRNAGTLLRELCYWDFDLVLHGHKHLQNFVRLTFDSADQPRSEIAVLAAGSATKRQTVSGQNSFNLIKVYRSGSITFRSVRYGQGTSGEVESPWSSGFQRLLPLNELKMRAYARARAGQEICCDSVTFKYVVNESGSAQCERQVRGLRGLHEERVRKRRLEFSVVYGAIAGGSVMLNEESRLAGHVLNGVSPLACKVSSVQVVLTGQRLTADVGTDYGLNWRLVNSFATSNWECVAMGQPDARDWVSTVVRIPSKRLRLEVDLPATFANPSPQLIVRRSPEYPLLKINDQGDIETGDSENWELDPDLTDLEKASVRVVGNRCEADIEYPMVGHIYELRWRVDTHVAPTTVARRGMALQIRRTLLKLAHPDTDPAVTALVSLGNDMLKKVTDQLIHPLIGSSYALNEQLDCALFVYNDTGKCFDLVAEGPGGDTGPLIVKSIPLNAGVSGATFKHRGVNLYIAAGSAGSDGDGGYVYFPDDVPLDRRPNYEALLAIPLNLDDVSPGTGSQTADVRETVPPEELIAIFTITTDASDNKLLTLTAPSNPLNNLEKHHLVTELWAIAVQYFKGLSESVRNAAKSP
jgi:hypothetical protein